MSEFATLIPYLGLLGLAFAAGSFLAVGRKPAAGNERMREIGDLIHTGAMAFLRREYSILGVFVIFVAGLILWQLER